MPSNDWPLASDFNRILQNPKLAFRDAELKLLDIEKDRNKQPRARSGAFANVYRGSFPNGKGPNGTGSVAVRVFTSASPERRERYQAIAEYLAKRRLESLVGFTYRDDGIRSAGDGKWYPLVVMDWVPGETLQDWVGERCLAKQKAALAQLSNLWIDIIRELAAASIAHGDLQQGNVMVTQSGRLKLVDYDCMCVPKLVGRKNLEIGVDPYQHPQRNPDTPLSADLDNFSALFILVALKALAAAPELWQTYVARPGYDKLLFRHEDLHSPRESRLMSELGRSPDKEVQRLSRELVELMRVDLHQVPPLAQFLFSLASVESLLNQRDFDAAVDLLTRNKKGPGDAPPALGARIRDAQQRMKQRQDLEQAVAAGDEPAMQRCYLPKLLDDYPRAGPSVAVAKLAPRVIPILERLQRAGQAKRWREFVQLWDANQALLGSRKSAQRFAFDVRAWRERNQACDAVLSLVAQPACDTAVLASAWQRLAALGGHPEAEPHRARIEKLAKRETAWGALARVPSAFDETCDGQLVAAWNEALFAGWDRAERERPRLKQARDRLALIAQIRLQAAEPLSTAGEQNLVRLAKDLPDGYRYVLGDRVGQAVRRLATLTTLEQALREPASDRSLAEVAVQLAQLQARELLSPAQNARLLLAERRAPVLAELKPIPPNYPPQQAPQFDRKLLAAWKEDLLADCHDAQPWRARWECAGRRKKTLALLEGAIGAGDKMKIVELVGDASLKEYPFPPQWGLAVKSALAEVQTLEALLEALKQGHSSQLLEVFDSRVIRQNAPAFAPHEAQLCDWVPVEILAADKLGLAPPVARKGLSAEPGDNGTFRICWKWPQPRFNEQCLVAVCKGKPQPATDPLALPVHVRLKIDRKRYEEGGGSHVIHGKPEWRGGYVAVWAVVDLGFQSFYSEPLILGQLGQLGGDPAGR